MSAPASPESASGASATSGGSPAAQASSTLVASGASSPVLAASGPPCPITARTSGPSTGCQQENLCSYVFPDSDGSSVRHLSVAREHRAANRQPRGGFDRSGGRPGMACSAFLAS